MKYARFLFANIVFKSTIRSTRSAIQNVTFLIPARTAMINTPKEFESLLDDCCEILTAEARAKGFDSISSEKPSKNFEDRVREIISGLKADDSSVHIDFHPPDQAFPDIAIGEYGIEVKYTASDTWRTIGNSVQENQRIDGVKHIYVVFCKMGGVPEVRWAKYESSVIHVRTASVPRFEIEIPSDPSNVHESLFKRMGVSYDDFYKLGMQEKMKYIRAYARQVHPDGKLWWIEDREGEHTLPVQARLYTKLTTEEKTRLRAEAALVCPGIVRPRSARDKYDDAVLFLLTYHGVLCHQARDLFSAGSVANPSNDDNGGIYIERALKLIEKEMLQASLEMDDGVFKEYWGESVEPTRRIDRWLEKADALAKGWKPSESLFLGRSQ